MMKTINAIMLIQFILYYVVFLYYFANADSGRTVEMKSLGYNGTWDDFCNSTNMDADFANYTDHDLKRLRIMLCQLREKNMINQDSIPAFTAYKYCFIMRSTYEGFYESLKNKFAQHFLQLAGETPTTNAPPTDQCYTKTMDTFYKECMGKGNPCHRMFQSLISSICVKPGISSQDISRYIVEVCDGKFVTDEINWDPIYMSLSFTR